MAILDGQVAVETEGITILKKYNEGTEEPKENTWKYLLEDE